MQGISGEQFDFKPGDYVSDKTAAVLPDGMQCFVAAYFSQGSPETCEFRIFFKRRTVNNPAACEIKTLASIQGGKTNGS